MYDKTILFSAYRCNPNGISEAYAAFKWLDILLKRYHIILATTVDNEKEIKEFYITLPSNLTIISFKDNYPFKSNEIIANGLKLGYFIFNKKLRKYLKQNTNYIENSDILFHKSPMSFRYLSCLSEFKKPFIFGPTGGGIQTAPELKSYFKSEYKIFKLRVLDKFLLNLRPYRRQFLHTKTILITLGYGRNIFREEYQKKIVEILDTGIDCEDYSPEFNGQTLSLNDTINLLFVGRLVRYKGAELLINAIPGVLSKLPNTNLLLNIVGDGKEKKTLENLVQELGLEKNVFLHGSVSKPKVKEFYNNSSIFCFPSLKEASGNAIIEAMSYSLPILTIDNGGPKFICPEEGAIKIPITSEYGIIKELQESIISLIENPKKRHEMGKFNRKYCLENYDWKILEKIILKFFSNEIEPH